MQSVHVRKVKQSESQWCYSLWNDNTTRKLQRRSANSWITTNVLITNAQLRRCHVKITSQIDKLAPSNPKSAGALRAIYWLSSAQQGVKRWNRPSSFAYVNADSIRLTWRKLRVGTTQVERKRRLRLRKQQEKSVDEITIQSGHLKHNNERSRSVLVKCVSVVPSVFSLRFIF